MAANTVLGAAHHNYDASRQRIRRLRDDANELDTFAAETERVFSPDHERQLSSSKRVLVATSSGTSVTSTVLQKAGPTTLCETT